MPRRVSNPHFQ